MSNDYNGKKRSELPDSVFGIPQERKYPMPDEKHTRSAIKLFNHVDPKYEEQLAKAVIKNMKKYGIDGSVVGPNNRLRKYLPKDMIKESSIEEGFLKSDKDIYYNKDKFDSGEINLCFITGLIGSGKTTMSKEISSKNIECYEIDDVIFNYCLSDDDLKDKKLLYLFFNGIGKKYRYRYKDNEYNHNLYYSFENYEKDITIDFVKYSIEYASSYTNKIVIDGIWIYLYIEPKLLSDYAVYIKGTSMVKSSYRATNRGIQNKIDKGTDLTPADIAKKYIFRIKKDLKFGKMHMQKLKSFRSYFEKQLTNESVSSTVSKDHKQKGYISLSSLKKVHITESVINKYKKEYPVLRHVRCKDTNEYICDGYMWFKENDLVCYVGSCQYTDDHTKWIVSLEIIPKYRGYGLSNQILDYCVKSMKCKYLSVNKNNELAKKIYDKYGFRVYHEDNTMYYMTIDKSIKESSIEEGFLKSDKDIYYNKDKFDSGEINLCFITGLSGSGKSTMGRNMSSKNIEHYEMDDVICNDNFSDDNLKEYGGLISSFFKGAGKSFRLIQDDDKHNDSVFNTHKNYEKEITQAFVKHAISYCKSHKETKYVCDGIWIFMFIKPEQLKDCAVYIKGTSSIKSGYRALKRDIDEDKRNGMTSLQIFKHEFKRVKEDILYARENQKELKSFRSYFEKQSVDESVSILPQDTGISTVIFDIGDVLVSANIKDYLMADPEIPNDIIDELLKLWFIDKDEVDDTMDLDTYREIVNKRMGVEFSKYIPKLFKYNIECVTAFDYTIPMIQDLKDKGYKVYYLSNWSAWTYDLLQEAGKFDFLKLMDGGVFSYDVGYMKPDEEIYKILLNKYKINPEEAIFFDDREENIEAANKLGIHGVHFPRHDASIVYNNLYGRKLAKTIYEDMDNIRYDFDQSYNDKVFGVPSIQEYGTTGGTIVGANQPDSVYIVNYMQNNVFSGYKEPKQAICKKGMNQMYTTKNGKAIPVDIDKFKEEASDISVFRFKETPILSFDKIIENASVDGDFYMLLTGDYPTNQHEIEYDNRFVQEENFFDKLDDITYCTESTIIGQIETTDYPYMKILTESMEGRCWNYYRDINGVFAMNELTGLRTPSYEDITDIPNSQIQLIERGTVYFGD